MSAQYTETWNEFLERYPDLVFVRTRKQIHSAAEVDDNIIYEEDTLPLIKGRTQIIPVDETAYPHCLKYGSAMETGIWAVNICEKNGWDICPEIIWEILRNQEIILLQNEEFSSI